MNLRDIRYLVNVAETRHFGQAAKRCHVSQPTLSAQIKKVEAELGVIIFERNNRTVTTTPIGEAIIKHAHEILQESDAIEQLAQAHRDPIAGSLRLGAILTLSPYLIPMLLKPLKRDYPQMELLLTEETNPQLLQQLRSNEIDAALLATPPDDDDLVEIPLFDEPFWLAHPRNHTLHSEDEITRKDLEKMDMLLLNDGHCLADQVKSLVRKRGRSKSKKASDLKAASLETLMQLVSAGFGSTLIPALALRGSWVFGQGITTQRLNLPEASRRIRIVHRRTYPRTKALFTLAEIIKRNVPNTVTVIDPIEELLELRA